MRVNNVTKRRQKLLHYVGRAEIALRVRFLIFNGGSFSQPHVCFFFFCLAFKRVGEKAYLTTRRKKNARSVPTKDVQVIFFFMSI